MKDAKLTQGLHHSKMGYQETIGSNGSSVNIQKLAFKRQKDWKYVGHNLGLQPLHVAFYTNLQSLYNQFNYNLDHIWNFDEISVEVGKQFGTKILTKRGSNEV